MPNPYAEKIATHLERVEPFDALSPDQLARLAERTTIERYAEGAQIIRCGDVGHTMYVIASGHVSIPVRDRKGRTRFEAQLPPGQCFGEMALLTGETRSADAFAATPCTVLSIPRDAVMEMVDGSPRVASFLTEILGERLMQGDGITHVGKYELVRRIGRGGMSIVFEGHHPGLERPCAVKMLSHQLVYRRNFAERFRNEARIIATLQHPHIVQVFDMEEAYATFFIVMEMLDGIDLSKVVKRKPMAPREVRRILLQVCSALDYAHSRGVIHRDLKPSNVRLLPDGNVKLLDFGLAWVQRYENVLDEDEDIVLGTPYYMSPEQAQGLDLDLRTDVYNLGVLAYEMLTGERPFVGGSKSEVQRRHVEDPIPDVQAETSERIPADLVELVHTCLQKHPADRFQTCAEVTDFLSRRGTTTRIRTQAMRVIYEERVAERVEAAIEKFRRQIEKIPGAEFGDRS